MSSGPLSMMPMICPSPCRPWFQMTGLLAVARLDRAGRVDVVLDVLGHLFDPAHLVKPGNGGHRVHARHHTQDAHAPAQAAVVFDLDAGRSDRP